MRKALVSLGAIGLIGFGVLAAPTAAGASDTPVTFEIDAGALSMTAPSDDVGLGAASAGTPTISGQLGTVTVDDERDLVSGSWTVTVISTGFTTGGGSAAETIPAGDITYDPGTPFDPVGDATYTPGDPGSLNPRTPLTAMSASDETGVGGVSWDPTITVHLPAQVVAGTYTGTITYSFA
jgi:hypothetical protein